MVPSLLDQWSKAAHLMIVKKQREGEEPGGQEMKTTIPASQEASPPFSIIPIVLSSYDLIYG